MKTLVHRFPKWLLSEKRFRINFFREAHVYNYHVTLLSPDSTHEFTGIGASVADAAKSADKEREKWAMFLWRKV